VRFHIHIFELLSGGDTGMAQHFLHMPKMGAVVQNNYVCPIAKKLDAADNFVPVSWMSHEVSSDSFFGL
jgi:hypothetical protein